jgi:RNA polymerase sigma-70 factor (ECF subfamily)
MSGVQCIALPLELRSLLATLSVAEVADDQRWIVQLLRQHGPAVVTLLWRMLGREQDVLDAYQTAVCSITARGRDAVQSNPGGYFYRIAMNAGITTLRGRRMERQRLANLAEAQARRGETPASRDGEPALDQSRIMEQMRQAIFRLPAHLRDVVVLRELAELPYAQVAEVLGITVGSARLYRRQAIVRLATMLEEEAIG